MRSSILDKGNLLSGGVLTPSEDYLSFQSASQQKLASKQISYVHKKKSLMVVSNGQIVSTSQIIMTWKSARILADALFAIRKV